eukprot:CAMPEP_0172756516 /NCGR_PEP_ID=MMETSP1074-20121228/161917_1 /TAXON_ID=2916 /ORGANISM="Ceratium fusus, Strain PA161109" /LENGTH=62 /DNA_ID=CAMNT_0013589783 /DNA_START=69 /DNA_END=253 /DNA_ORIENTATION=+
MTTDEAKEQKDERCKRPRHTAKSEPDSSHSGVRTGTSEESQDNGLQSKSAMQWPTGSASHMR